MHMLLHDGLSQQQPDANELAVVQYEWAEEITSIIVGVISL